MTTIEVHQILIVRRPEGAAPAWCPACLKEVEMLPTQEAARLAGLSMSDISQRVVADDLHFIETADGGLVCLPSLLK